MWSRTADEFTVYKKGGRSGHTLFQAENAITFSYLPILTGWTIYRDATVVSTPIERRCFVAPVEWRAWHVPVGRTANPD
jgi:hypothetical protein